MWCWWRVEISWTDREKKEPRGISHTHRHTQRHTHTNTHIQTHTNPDTHTHTDTHKHTHRKTRKAYCIGHILPRNSFLKHVVEGNIKVTGRRGWRQKQLLDDLKESGRYWRMKEEALSGWVSLEGAMDLS